MKSEKANELFNDKNTPNNSIALLLFFILGNPSFAVPSNLVGEIPALIGLFPIDSL